MTEKRHQALPDSNLLEPVLLAALSLVYEITLFYLYFQSFINTPALLIYHGIFLGMLLSLAIQSYFQGKDIRHFLLCILAVFGAGPLGALGFLIQSGFYCLLKRQATPMEIWLSELFPEASVSPASSIFQRISAGLDDYQQMKEPSSFHDLFSYGSLEQKQAVLDVIVKDFHPSYFSILRRALNDPANTVRIQAAAIVAKIDDDLEKEMQEILLQNRRLDPVWILKLAQFHDLVSSCDVFDSHRKKDHQNQALLLYREYLKSFPSDLKVHFAIGSLLFHSRAFLPYISWYEEYKKKEKTIPHIAHIWYLEVLYQLHRYQELAIASRA